ncbi:MAG TPA: response regulator [Deltaproteobacteria bacterium]|nr:response regulator [Deltaproteobacteria bacterium]
MKVLLVDDEEDFVTALAERLQLRGMEVQFATDGETALRHMETNPPDVVVLDMMMPGMGGGDVLKRMKAGHSQTPVILLTGHTSIDAGPAGVQQGAFDYLVKPVDISELIAKMENALRSGKSE